MSELRKKAAANFTKTAGVKRMARISGLAHKEKRLLGELNRHAKPGSLPKQEREAALLKSFKKRTRDMDPVKATRKRLALYKETAKTTPDYPTRRWKGLWGRERIEAARKKGLSRGGRPIDDVDWIGTR